MGSLVRALVSLGPAGTIACASTAIHGVHVLSLFDGCTVPMSCGAIGVTGLRACLAGPCGHCRMRIGRRSWHTCLPREPLGSLVCALVWLGPAGTVACASAPWLCSVPGRCRVGTVVIEVRRVLWQVPPRHKCYEGSFSFQFDIGVPFGVLYEGPSWLGQPWVAIGLPRRIGRQHGFARAVYAVH